MGQQRGKVDGLEAELYTSYASLWHRAQRAIAIRKALSIREELGSLIPCKMENLMVIRAEISSLPKALLLK